jgi:hypothetical protein
MSAPQYIASGGVIFQREHAPMTMAAARLAVGIHRMNASHWLTTGEERTLAARLALAKTEMALANELEAAIAEITNPQAERAAA